MTSQQRHRQVMQTLDFAWIVTIWARNMALLILVAGNLHLWLWRWRGQGETTKGHAADFQKVTAGVTIAKRFAARRLSIDREHCGTSANE